MNAAIRMAQIRRRAEAAAAAWQADATDEAAGGPVTELDEQGTMTEQLPDNPPTGA